MLRTGATLLSAMAVVLAFAGCGLNKSSHPAQTSNYEDFFQTHSITKFGLAGTHTVALTFDDGPGNGTISILNTLRQYHIRATFFIMGTSLTPRGMKLLQAIHAEGHVIGNHTYDHPQLSKRYYTSNPGRLTGELLRVHNKIAPYLDHQKNWYFRAPYGAWTASDARIANANSTLQHYIGPIFWTVGGDLIRGRNGQVKQSADWACWSKHVSVSACEQGYLNETLRHDGGVVLMHDIHSKTAQMLPKYIADLVARGFRFVTLEDIGGLDAQPQVASLQK